MKTYKQLSLLCNTNPLIIQGTLPQTTPSLQGIAYKLVHSIVYTRKLSNKSWMER